MNMLLRTANDKQKYLLLIKVRVHFQHHLFCMRCRIKIIIIIFIHDLINSSSILHTAEQLLKLYINCNVAKPNEMNT